MNHENVAADRLSFKARLSYGLGNLGFNLLFGMAGAYLMYFYVDVYGIAPATVASIFLLARLADAFFDPFLGLMIDRTRTRFGRFKPYLIFLTVPYVACGIAIFSKFPLDSDAKITLAFVTYTLFGLLYSCLSLPLNSMLPSLTPDPRERTATNALREFLGTGATVGITYATLPLVAALGGSNEPRGFFWTAVLLGVVTILMVATMIRNTQERALEDTDEAKPTIRQSLQAIRGNWPWLATLLMNLFFWIGFISRAQSFVYYARDVLGRPDLASLLASTMLAIVPGIAMSVPIALRIGKRKTAALGFVFGGVSVGLIASVNSVAWVLFMSGLSFMALGLMAGVLFALMADAVDHGKAISGVHAPGFLFAAVSVGVKIGMSIGGALGAWLLAYGGYRPGGEITPLIQSMISYSQIAIPAACFLACAASMALFYVPTEHRR